MSIRFQKRVSIFPGFRLNFSASGALNPTSIILPNSLSYLLFFVPDRWWGMGLWGQHPPYPPQAKPMVWVGRVSPRSDRRSRDRDGGLSRRFPQQHIRQGQALTPCALPPLLGEPRPIGHGHVGDVAAKASAGAAKQG